MSGRSKSLQHHINGKPWKIISGQKNLAGFQVYFVNHQLEAACKLLRIQQDTLRFLEHTVSTQAGHILEYELNVSKDSSLECISVLFAQE